MRGLRGRLASSQLADSNTVGRCWFARAQADTKIQKKRWLVGIKRRIHLSNLLARQISREDHTQHAKDARAAGLGGIYAIAATKLAGN